MLSSLQGATSTPLSTPSTHSIDHADSEPNDSLAGDSLAGGPGPDSPIRFARAECQPGASTSIRFAGARTQPRPSKQIQPDIGDPQFQEWFEKNRGAKDLDLQSIKDLCIASMIMAARDLLNTKTTAVALEDQVSAQYWVDHPEETTLPFSFCCHMIGIRLPIGTAQCMYLGNLVAIAGLNMPNTGFPLESL